MLRAWRVIVDRWVARIKNRIDCDVIDESVGHAKYAKVTLRATGNLLRAE